MGVVVFMVIMAIITALRKSIGLIQPMEYYHLMYIEMTRANKNDGRCICKSNDTDSRRIAVQVRMFTVSFSIS